MRAFSTVADSGLEMAIAAVGTLQVRNPARRIAATLLRIAPRPQAGRPAQVNITQEDLGEISNAARDVANRTLKRFEREGWISTGYRAVTILRPDRLAQFVAGGG
jgi:CRP-like cAMP-binding protein